MNEKYRFTPVGKNESGTVKYLVELTGNEVSISRGDSTYIPAELKPAELDEETDLDKAVQDIGLLKMYGQFNIWMDTTGVIKKLEGIDRFYEEWLAKASKIPAETKKEMGEKLRKSGGNQSIMSWFNREFCYLPDTVAGTGQTWEKVLVDASSMPNEYTYTWKLVKADADTAWLEAQVKRKMVFRNANFESTGKGTKKLRVDMRTGWIIDGHLDYVINNTLNRGQGEGFESVLEFDVDIKGHTE
jgi:hypothetical protein